MPNDVLKNRHTGSSPGAGVRLHVERVAGARPAGEETGIERVDLRGIDRDEVVIERRVVVFDRGHRLRGGIVRDDRARKEAHRHRRAEQAVIRGVPWSTRRPTVAGVSHA
jgi:hypothetical protein